MTSQKEKMKITYSSTTELNTITIWHVSQVSLLEAYAYLLKFYRNKPGRHILFYSIFFFVKVGIINIFVIKYLQCSFSVPKRQYLSVQPQIGYNIQRTYSSFQFHFEREKFSKHWLYVWFGVCLSSLSQGAERIGLVDL